MIFKKKIEKVKNIPQYQAKQEQQHFWIFKSIKTDRGHEVCPLDVNEREREP